MTVILGDCLEEMPKLTEQADMILCDLPYGTTACKWDTIIPFEPLWENYKRLIKPNGAIVLFGSQPFTSALVMSNPKWFKYTWVWNKKFAGNFSTAKYVPMKTHEELIVFYLSAPVYNPQMIQRDKPIRTTTGSTKTVLSKLNANIEKEYTEKFPITILDYPRILGTSKEKYPHPTQKPVALCEYLIRTYTNEGDLVLDNCAGSGTTGVACLNTNREFILIEKEKEYYDIIVDRLKKVPPRLL